MSQQQQEATKRPRDDLDSDDDMKPADHGGELHSFGGPMTLETGASAAVEESAAAARMSVTVVSVKEGSVPEKLTLEQASQSKMIADFIGMFQ